jgi:hypothetical protein
MSSVAGEVQINAAQASHLDRIGREHRARRFAALGGKVCTPETAFPKERTFLVHYGPSTIPSQDAIPGYDQ